MPHKHTRREKDLSTFDLPPTQIAKPLPVTSISKKKAPPPKKNDDIKKHILKRKRGGENDEHMPRAFKRLMAFANGRPTRSGLDNGDAPKNKKKAKAKEQKDAAQTSEKPAKNSDMAIRPGESMREFSQRVDAALPLSGLVNKTTVKDGKDPLGLKVRRTKKERKMHKLYDEWREEERKIQEKREEERELEEEKAMENDVMGVTWKLDMEDQGKGKKKKGKRAKLIGEDAGKEEDPWKDIIKKRGEAKVGLNEVAQAPPELIKPGKKLLVSGAAVEVSDIPKAAGSLRQREELQDIRNDVVASYREMMAARRDARGEAPS
ncbi:hypothetical protein QBC34DRAFT_398889 [Podospora aff. communis PSN243]|uniref:Urease accessory protein n=1 Tax=Podospora aff. communis PSN243 TaxID=3040156 RepID=A0AAV9GXR1_9PEZI|nr:hypothetical protein QBC34DRAFT_398889 [Podospora aff. communis PSN243]